MGEHTNGLKTTWIDNRHQHVQLNDEQSDLLRVTCGVPQGYVLGPKLFILYINDICNVSRLLPFVLFVDDANLLYSVEKELATFKRWFDINKLSFNLYEMKYIYLEMIKL